MTAGVSALVDFTTAVALRLHLDSSGSAIDGRPVRTSEILRSRVRHRARRRKFPLQKWGRVNRHPRLARPGLQPTENCKCRSLKNPRLRRTTVAATEEANPKSANLDQLGAREIVELFRRGREIGAGSVAAKRQRAGARDRDWRPTRLPAAGECFTSAQERVAGSEFSMPLKFRRRLARRPIYFRQSSPGGAGLASKH